MRCILSFLCIWTVFTLILSPLYALTLMLLTPRSLFDVLSSLFPPKTVSTFFPDEPQDEGHYTRNDKTRHLCGLLRCQSMSPTLSPRDRWERKWRREERLITSCLLIIASYCKCVYVSQAVCPYSRNDLSLLETLLLLPLLLLLIAFSMDVSVTNDREEYTVSSLDQSKWSSRNNLWCHFTLFLFPR